MPQQMRSLVFLPHHRRYDFISQSEFICTVNNLKGLPVTAQQIALATPSDYAEWDSKHFLILVDAHSKLIEATHMPHTTATATIQALRSTFAIHGLPVELVSNNGPPFTSEEFAIFMRQNGIRHLPSPPFHPSTNGAAERAVQTFKNGMRKSTLSPLSHKLAEWLLHVRTTPHTITGQAPCEMLMHCTIRTRLALLHPQVTATVAKRQDSHKLSHDGHKPLRQFRVGDPVLVRDYITKRPQWTSGTVTQVIGPLKYHVYLPAHNRTWKRHIDQIQPHHTSHEAKEQTGALATPLPEMVEGEKSMTSAPQSDTSTLPFILSRPSDMVSLPAAVMPTTPEETPSSTMSDTAIPEEDPLPQYQGQLRYLAYYSSLNGYIYIGWEI